MNVRREASILHADLDSFYAAVEQRDDPALRGRPVLVGGGVVRDAIERGTSEERERTVGVVLAASYEARAYGVRGGMGAALARRLCPHALVVPPRFEAYTAASRAVFAVFDDVTPIVEAMSIDEAFLDVGGLRRLVGPPAEIAVALRARVRADVGLVITVGVARTKFLAKVASRVAKPDGLLVVPPEHELAFLHPLPVDALWGVGPVTAAKLADRGIRTVAEVAELPLDLLTAMVGPAAGRQLHALARNRDPRPVRGSSAVELGRRRRSIGSQSALGRGRRSADEVDAIAVAIVDRVTRRLRAAHRLGRTVVLRLRFDDYTRVTRSHTLPEPTAHTPTVLAATRSLLAAARPLIADRGLTLLGLSVADLGDDDAVQLVLPFEREGHLALDGAVDAVQDRYGRDALTRAVLLGRATGSEVPKLPD